MCGAWSSSDSPAALATACLPAHRHGRRGRARQLLPPNRRLLHKHEEEARIIKLRFATFSFTGGVEICSDQVGGNRECRKFRLREKGDLYARSVNWERHFGGGAGLYKAIWYFEGNQLGPALSFLA